MSENEKNKAHYSVEDIEKYFQGKFGPNEMHAIEKAAIDDPFLADAMEGIRHALQKQETGTLYQDIEELKQRLDRRITKKRKVIFLLSDRGWWQAAVVLLILAIGGITTYYIVHNNKVSLAVSSLAKKENPDHSNADSSKTAIVLSPPSYADSASIAETLPATRSFKIIARTSDRKKGRTAHKQDTSVMANNIASLSDKPNAGVQQQSSPRPTTAAGEEVRNTQPDFKKSPAQSYFSGKVTDKYNQPIVSAHIELKNKKINTVTDKNGNFRLDIKDHDPTANAEIRSEGYDPAFINLNNGAGNTIILHESKSYLPQVVVGYGKSGKIETNQIIPQDAEPINGWDQYKIYLDKNKRPPLDSLGLKGTVLVSFMVGKNAKLSDFTIEQSIGPGYDEEAIRLIKEGPHWKLLAGKKTRAFVVVNF
ncbi:MAG TPA: carboxypeptidase-like regulatory domain-containing protein [Puia sp.]|nr:carboxypeptidase-like regulatory domain-containing protein [Puia sp.]